MFNKLLERQINKFLQGKELSVDCLKFLEAISNSYDHYEEDRNMLERSMELTSNEMIELNCKIRQDAAELNTLVNNIQEVFFAIDMPKHEIISMSEACEKVYGYPAKAFMENSNLWYEVVLEEDKKIIDANYPVMNAGKAFSHEYRIRHGDGSTRWIETKITPTLSGGDLIRIDGVTAYITKRKVAEEALQANERKFRALIQNSSDVISISDETGKFIFVSDSVTLYSGFTTEEVLGRNIIELIHPEDADNFILQTVKLFKKPGNYISVVLRMITKGGGYEWCEGVLTNLLHEPSVKGVVANIRVITDRKAAEERLKAYNIELQKRNMELDKFVYSVSHDLRAPLRSVLGVVDLSMDMTEDVIMLKHFDMIKGSIKRLDAFILDILDYSRNSRLEIKKEKIDFEEILSDIKKNLKYMGNNNRYAEIKTNIKNGFCFKSDRSRIAIILNNLVSNAIRYQNPKTECPYVSINVDLSELEARIVVQDNGIGIHKDQLEKIFEMFYRVSSNSVGSGLGLYIVKETIEKLKGRIEVESEPERGTIMSIFIPNIN